MQHHLIEALESRIAPAGLVTVQYDARSGELTLTGDAEPNAFEIFQAAPGVYRIEGKNDAATLTETSIDQAGNGAMTIGRLTKLTISSGDGDDEVSLANLRKLSSITVDSGTGSDRVDGFNVGTSGATAFTTGSGADAVRLSGFSTIVGGNLTVTDTDGGVVFTLGAAVTTVRGEFVVNGGLGADQVTSAADSSVKIGRGIAFNGGAGGTNTLELGDQGVIRIGRSATGKSITFTGAAGPDTLSVGASIVGLKGSIEMDGGLGADLLDLDGVKVNVGRSLSGVSLLLSGGSGNDEIDVRGAAVKIGGLVKLDGGSESDLLDLTNIHRLVTNGSIELDGGVGEDHLALEAESLRLAGSVTMLGGDDADTVSIEADGTIAGSVSMMLGGATAGLQDIHVRGLSGLANSLKVNGGFTVAGTGSAASTDALKLTNLVVGGAATIETGDGDTDVDIDNLTVFGQVVLNTGDGADDVGIERDATFGVSLFRQAMAISLGSGNDFLRIGKDSSNNRVEFLATLVADGGEGADNRNDVVEKNDFRDADDFTARNFEAADLP